MVIVSIVVRVPYVVWEPGATTNLLGTTGSLRIVDIQGQEPAETTGKILATSMVQSSASSSITLPALIANYLRPNRSVMPADAVLTQGELRPEALDARRIETQASREQAMAAGVRVTGGKVVERPKIIAVRANGPAHNILYSGDFIRAIDDTPMSTENDVRLYLRNNKQVGGQAVVEVQRGSEVLIVTVAKLVGSPSDGTIASMGVTIGTGYLYQPSIKVNLPLDVSHPSQGLALGITTVDLLHNKDLTQGITLAAVGRVSSTGEVTRVAGINEHAQSAANQRATLFLIPIDNCLDISLAFPGMTIVPVSTLKEAVEVVDRWNDSTAEIPSC
jgi:PDZ domain-containing protein